MYLRQLEIEGFKNFGSRLTIEFHAGLNVLVGENGAGKTGVINALRQLFQDSESGKRSVNERDFHKSFELDAVPASSFAIQAIFGDLSVFEKVALDSWCGEQEDAVLNLTVLNREIRGRYSQELWGGAIRTGIFNQQTLDLIHCIYLPPLRDAEQKLREGRQSRLSRLMKALCKDQLQECAKSGTLHPLEVKVADFNSQLADEQNIKRANALISSSLRAALGERLSQNTTIQFSESNFTRIVEGLRLLYFPNGSPAELSQFRSLDENSLGYNNLLYIASILAELIVEDGEGAGERTLHKLLLIEEPEAHLHPQLQIRLLKHLQEVALNKNIQVVITTHSTVISSAVSINNIIHISGGVEPLAVPARFCGLSEPSRRFIDRWLDVTKSNLLFSKGVILVEGVAEAIALPELAKIVLANRGKGLNTLDDYGVSVINLNGIYFAHFMQLFCELDGALRSRNLPIPCAGLTDKDPAKTQKVLVQEQLVEVVVKPHQGNLAVGTNPALALIPTIAISQYGRLFSGELKTFEYDLAMTGDNLPVMLQVAYENWSTDGPVKASFKDMLAADFGGLSESQKAEYAYELLERIDSNSMGKGLYAQLLADKLEQGDCAFVVPHYIKQAICWACGIAEEPL
ncbi:ATP-dependent nuclease [Pseudomonas putida]|uniref:ATP-dependent nuclease n=1 Tax=Pseudomonas putida TaxID=303 RepID=UPI00062B02D5|nr:AAA family ATPase [Pseudomonas putida]KKX62374.1 recombinase RecF [Pseudomonas putida]